MTPISYSALHDAAFDQGRDDFDPSDLHGRSLHDAMAQRRAACSADPAAQADLDRVFCADELGSELLDEYGMPLPWPDEDLDDDSLDGLDLTD